MIAIFERKWENILWYFRPEVHVFSFLFDFSCKIEKFDPNCDHFMVPKSFEIREEMNDFFRLVFL